MPYHILHRKWRTKRAAWMMMIPELLANVALLVLFGIAQPDLYRTSMWTIGHEYGFNSDPRMILYAYANHEPLPTVPFVWSQTLTNFNVAISVVTLFILLTKMIMTIMNVWYPLFAAIANTCMVALFTTSVYGQMGPDYADERYPSKIAWYIEKSCDYAAKYNAVGSCKLAKGTFAATVVMLVIFVVQLCLAIYSLLPSKNDDNVESDDDEGTSPTDRHAGKDYEMSTGLRSPMTPGLRTPYTPRTMAFRTLDNHVESNSRKN